jgi:hypothetical protein
MAYLYPFKEFSLGLVWAERKDNWGWYILGLKGQNLMPCH